METLRLALRYFEEQDLDSLSAILADPEVMQFSAVGPMARAQTQEFLREILASYQQQGYGLYAATHQEQQLIGYCGLIRQVVDGNQEIEVGYRLARFYWGKGLATEAATAVRDYGLHQRGFKRLISMIDPNNYRSIRVAEKIGMEYEKDSVFKNIPVRIYSPSNS
ncbi:MAG: GNAT family N-acetyltransferase [Cyanophyceae cyanobacterium]